MAEEARERFHDISKAFVPVTIVLSMLGLTFAAGRWVGTSEGTSTQLTRIEQKLDKQDQNIKDLIEQQNYRHDLYMDHIGSIREALAKSGIDVK